jgi:peptidoglycan hydrolase-like protein with peptidoglycan-binding domain
MKKLSYFVSFSLFLLIFAFIYQGVQAQNIYKKNRSDNTACKKISQNLFKGKTAVTKSQQKILIYEVGRLQKLLDKLGYYGPKPDYGENYDIGYYDDATVDAVKKYQSENMPWTKPTGSVLSETLNFINKYEFCNSDRRFAQVSFNKTYTVAPGVTFKYPGKDLVPSATIPEEKVRNYVTYLDVCNVDEYADPKMTKISLCSNQEKVDAYLGAAMIPQILPGKTVDTCLQAPKEVKSDDINASAMLNGLKFYNYKLTTREVGHEMRNDIYHIWRNNKCYEFKMSAELARLGGEQEDTDDLINALDQVFGKMRASLETIEFTK